MRQKFEDAQTILELIAVFVVLAHDSLFLGFAALIIILICLLTDNYQI